MRRRGLALVLAALVALFLHGAAVGLAPDDGWTHLNAGEAASSCASASLYFTGPINPRHSWRPCQ